MRHLTEGTAAPKYKNTDWLTYPFWPDDANIGNINKITDSSSGDQEIRSVWLVVVRLCVWFKRTNRPNIQHKHVHRDKVCPKQEKQALPSEMLHLIFYQCSYQKSY